MKNIILKILKNIAINYNATKYVKRFKNIIFQSFKHIIIEELELNKFSINNIFNDYIIDNYVKNIDLKLSEVNSNGPCSNPTNNFTDYLIYLNLLNYKKKELQFNIFFCDKIEIDWDTNHTGYFYDNLLLNIENVYILLNVIELSFEKGNVQHGNKIGENDEQNGQNKQNEEGGSEKDWIGMVIFFTIVFLNFLKEMIVEIGKWIYYLISLLLKNISYINILKKIFRKIILENTLSINVKNMNIIFEEKISKCEQNMFLSIHVENLNIDNYNYIKNKKKKLREEIDEQRVNKNLSGFYNYGKLNKIKFNENKEYLKMLLTGFTIYYDIRTHLISGTDINLDKNKYIFFYNYNINFMHKRKCLVEDIDLICIISKNIQNIQNYVIDLIVSSLKINFIHDKFYDLFLFIYKYFYLLCNKNVCLRKDKKKKKKKQSKNGYFAKTIANIEFNMNIEMFKIMFYYNYYYYLQIVLKDVNFLIFFVKKEWKSRKIRQTLLNSSKPIVFNSYILKDFIFFIESFVIKEEYSKLSLTIYTKKKEFIYLNKRNMIIKRIQYNCNHEKELLKYCNLESKINRFINIISDGNYDKTKRNSINNNHELTWKDNGQRYIHDKTKKYSLYFRIYKKEKGIKNCQNPNYYINNIYVYIENIYFKIKNLDNIYSLISNIPDKFFFILYYIISTSKNLKGKLMDNKKDKLTYRRSNDICLNVRLNFIEIELKNRNMASFFFCIHNLALYNGNGKLRPYKRHYSGFNFFKRKKIIFCKITNIYSYIQNDKITHVLFYPFNLFFTIHNYLKKKMKIEILSLIIELNKNAIEIFKDIFFIPEKETSSNDLFYDFEKKRKKNTEHIYNGYKTFNNELINVVHKSFTEINPKVENILNEYDNFITISNELNILFSCIDIFVDVFNFEKNNKDDEKYDVSSSFSITSVLNTLENINIYFSFQYIHIYFFFNNDFVELGKKASNKNKKNKHVLKKKKYMNILSFFNDKNRANNINSLISINNVNVNNNIPIKPVEVFYIKCELKNVNFFCNVKKDNDKNWSLGKYSISSKFKITNFRVLYNFYFIPINLETFVMNGLCVYILKGSISDKEIIKIKKNEDSEKNKKSMFILNKCMLEYVDKENILINKCKCIINLNYINIFIYDFFINLFYYIYRNSRTRVFDKTNEKYSKKKEKKMKSNINSIIKIQSNYTKMLKRINICNDLLIAKNIFKIFIFFSIKKTNIFFIFYDKVNENKTYYNSDNLSKFYNTHLILQLNYFFTKLKNEIVHIKLRDTGLNAYSFNNDNFSFYQNSYPFISKYLNKIQTYYYIFKPRIWICLKWITLTRCNCFMHYMRCDINRRNVRTTQNEETIKNGQTECVVAKCKDRINKSGKKKKKILIKVDEINIKMLNLYNSILFINLHKIRIFNYLNFIEELNIYLQLFATTFKSPFFAKYFPINHFESRNEYMIEFDMKEKETSQFKNSSKYNKVENDELIIDKDFYNEDTINSTWIEIFYKMCIFKKVICCINVIKYNYTLISPIVNNDRKKTKKEILSLKIKKTELILKRNNIKNLNKYISYFKYNLCANIYGINIFIKKLKKIYILFCSNFLSFFSKINGYMPRNAIYHDFEKKKKKKKNIGESYVLYKNNYLKYIRWKNSSIGLFFKINRQIKRKISDIIFLKKNNNILINLEAEQTLDNKFPIIVKLELKSYIKNRENYCSENDFAFYLFLNEVTILSVVSIYVNIVNLFESLKKITNMWMKCNREANKNIEIEKYTQENCNKIEKYYRKYQVNKIDSVSFLQCLESLKIKVKNIFFLFYEYNMKMFIGFYLKEINNILYIDHLKKKKNSNEYQYYFKYIHKLTESVLFTNNVYFNSNNNIYIFEIFNNLVNKNNLSYLKGMFYFFKKQKIDSNLLFLRQKKIINNLKKKRQKEYNGKNNKIQNLSIWWNKQLKIGKKKYSILKKNKIIKTEFPYFINTNILLHKIIKLNKKIRIPSELDIDNKNKMVVFVKYYLKNKNTFIHIETKHTFKNICIYYPLYAIIELNKMVDALNCPFIYKLYLSTITNSQNNDNDYISKQKKCDISFDFKVCLLNFKINLLSAYTYSIRNIKEDDLIKNEIEFRDESRKKNKENDIFKVQKRGNNDDNSDSGTFEKKLEKKKKKKKKEKGKNKNGNEIKFQHLDGILKQKDVKKHKNEIEKKNRNNKSDEIDEKSILENKENEINMNEINRKQRAFLYVFVLKTDINIDMKNKNKKTKIKKKVINNSKKNNITFVNKVNMNVSFSHLNVTSGLLYICINAEPFLFNIIRVQSLFKSVYEYNNSSKYYFNMSRNHRFRLKRNENLISQIENKNISKITTKTNKIKFIIMREYCTYNTIDIMNILLFFQNISYYLNWSKRSYFASSYDIYNNIKHEGMGASQHHISGDALDIYSTKKNETNIDGSKRESYYYEEKERKENKRIIESSYLSYNNEVIKLENNLNEKNQKKRYKNKGMKRELKIVDEILDKGLCGNEKKSSNVNYCLNNQKKKAISKKNVNVIIGSKSIYINNNDLLILNLLIEELLFIQKKLKGGKVVYSCKYNYNGVIISSKFSKKKCINNQKKKKKKKNLNNAEKKRNSSQIIKRMKNKINISVDMLKIYFMTKSYVHELFSINSFNNIIKIENTYINNKMKYLFIFFNFNKVDTLTVIANDLVNFIYTNSIKTSFIDSFDLSCQYILNNKKNKFLIHIKDEININLNKNIINFFVLFKYNFLHDYFDYNEYSVFNQAGSSRDNSRVAIVKDLRKFIFYGNIFLREYVIIRNFTFYNLKYEYEDNVGYINKNEENLIVGNNLYLLNIYMIDGKINLSKKIYIKRAIQSLNNSNNITSNKDDGNFIENNDVSFYNNNEWANNDGNKNKFRPILNEKNYLYIDVVVQENKRCINIYPYFFIHVLYSKFYEKKKKMNENDVNRKDNTKMNIENNDWIKLKFIKEECINTCLIRKNEMLFSVPFNFIKKCKYIQLALKEDKKIFTSNKIKYKNIFNLQKYAYKDIYDIEHYVCCCFFYLFLKKEKKMKKNRKYISKYEKKKKEEIVENTFPKNDEYNNYYKIFNVMNIVKNNMHIISIESCIRIINLSPLDIKVLLKREKGSINTYSIKSFGYINVYEFNFLKNIILNFCMSIHRKWVEFIKIENENYFREYKNDNGSNTFSKDHSKQVHDNKKNGCHIISYKIIQFKNLYFVIYIYIYNNCYNIAFLSKYNIYNFTKNTLYYHLTHNEEECTIDELKYLSEIKKHKLKDTFNILKEHMFVLHPLIENEIIIDNSNLIKIKRNKFYNYSIDGKSQNNLIDEKDNTKKYINNYCFNHKFVINNNSSRILNTDVSIYEINKSYTKIINLNDEYIKIDINIVTIHSFNIVFIQFYPHIIIVNLTKYNLELKLKNNEEVKKKYQNINYGKKYNELKENNSYASCDSIQNDELNFSEQSECSISSYDEINKKEVPITVSSDNKIKNYFKAASQLFDITINSNKKNRGNYIILRKMSMNELNVNDKNAWDYISFKIKNKGEEEEEEVDNNTKEEGKYNYSEKTNVNRFANYEMIIEYLKKNANSNIKGANNLIGKKYTRCKYIKISKNMNKYFYMYKYKEIRFANRKFENNDEYKYYGIKEMLFNISCIEIKKTNYIFIKKIPFLLNYEMGYFQGGITIQYVSSESDIPEEFFILKNERKCFNETSNKTKKEKCNDYLNRRTYTLKKKEEHVLEIDGYENYQKIYDGFKKLNLGMVCNLKKKNFNLILKSYKEIVNNKIIKEGKIYIFNNLNIPIFVSPDKSNYLFYINKKYIYFKENKYFYFYFPKFILISKKLVFLFKTDNKVHEYRGVKNYMHIIKDDNIFQNFYVMKLFLFCSIVSTFQFYSFVFLRRACSSRFSGKKKSVRKNGKRKNRKEIVYFELYLVNFYCDIIINNNNEINIILNGINEWHFIKKILSINYFFNFLKNNKFDKYPKSISNVTYINNMYGLNSNDLLNVKCFIRSMNLLFNFENISNNSENLRQKIYINKIHLNLYTFQYFNNSVVEKKKRCIQFWGNTSSRYNPKTIKGGFGNTEEKNETFEKFDIHEFEYLNRDGYLDCLESLKRFEKSPNVVKSTRSDEIAKECLGKELAVECSKNIRMKNIRIKNKKLLGEMLENNLILRNNNEIYNIYNKLKNKIYCHYYSFMFSDYIRNNKTYKNIFKLLKSQIIAVCFNKSDFYKKISITIDNISIKKDMLYDKKKVEYNYTILTKYNKNESILYININLCKQTCMEYKHIYNTLNILYACSYINAIKMGKNIGEQDLYKIKKGNYSFSNILNNIKREKGVINFIDIENNIRNDIIKKAKYNIFNSNNFSRNREHALLYNIYYFYKKNGKIKKKEKDNNIGGNNSSSSSSCKRYKVKNLLEFIENIKSKKCEKKRKEIKNLSIEISSLVLTLDYNYFINILPLFYDYFCKKLKYLNPINNLKDERKVCFLHMYYYYYLNKLMGKKRFEKLEQIKNIGNYSYTNDIVICRQNKEEKIFLLYIHNINIRKTKIYINVNYLLKLFLTKNFLMNISAIKIQNKQKKNLKHILKKIKKIYFYNYISIFFYLLKNINISEHSSYTTLNFLNFIEKFLKNNLQLSPLQNLYSLIITLKYKCEYELNNNKINQDSYSINKKNIEELVNIENNPLLIMSERDKYSQEIDNSNNYFKNMFLFNYSNIFSMNIFSKNTTQITNHPKIHKSLMKKIMNLKERENIFSKIHESYKNSDLISNFKHTKFSQNCTKSTQIQFDNSNGISESSNIKYKDSNSSGNYLKKKKSGKMKKKKNRKTDRKTDRKTNVQNITHISFTHNLNIKE
ncbi:conserved Plasmodium protein, unknown function [Plasmodium berghei]|uniref:Uncharacterized protein n=1 Tax=Plasmodium berghei TaxID=5821 RepID=A0A1C6YB47_PLABE|nr:conserved Plasmodium protein, unknown function [Plasmodium berghei]